jgi:cobalt/nickel transport system permease protein
MTAGPMDSHARESRLGGLDARAKIVALIFFVVCVSVLKGTVILAAALLYVVSLLVISGLPAGQVIRRYLLAAPFCLMAAFSVYWYSGLNPSVAMFLRISTCVLALVLLSGVTELFDLLKGFRGLRVPRLFVSLLLFTYRYLFVISDEMERMSLARKARGARRGRHLLDRGSMRTISFSAGMVLVRAYERGKRMHSALQSRGYDGEIRTLRPPGLKAPDVLFMLVIPSFSALLLSLEWRLLPWA